MARARPFFSRGVSAGDGGADVPEEYGPQSGEEEYPSAGKTMIKHLAPTP